MRELPTEVPIRRPIDFAHPAGADRRENFARAEVHAADEAHFVSGARQF